MTLANWPDHLLTLAEWDALPEDNSRRVELVEGVLVVSPRPVARHQLIAQELTFALDHALRPAWHALIEIELTVDPDGPPTVRAPDVTVIRGAAADDRPRQDPADVIAVVEVLSPGSRRTDRVAKLADYAEAGIECYLVVDPGPPVTVSKFRLADGPGTTYAHVGEHRGTMSIALAGTEVALDLGALDR